jgi:hypothetical protein
MRLTRAKVLPGKNTVLTAFTVARTAVPAIESTGPARMSGRACR